MSVRSSLVWVSMFAASLALAGCKNCCKNGCWGKSDSYTTESVTQPYNPQQKAAPTTPAMIGASRSTPQGVQPGVTNPSAQAQAWNNTPNRMTTVPNTAVNMDPRQNMQDMAPPTTVNPGLATRSQNPMVVPSVNTDTPVAPANTDPMSAAYAPPSSPNRAPGVATPPPATSLTRTPIATSVPDSPSMNTGAQAPATSERYTPATPPPLTTTPADTTPMPRQSLPPEVRNSIPLRAVEPVNVPVSTRTATPPTQVTTEYHDVAAPRSDAVETPAPKIEWPNAPAGGETGGAPIAAPVNSTSPLSGGR